MPITWKNVEAASNKDGVALLAGAQQSMTSGLSTFENMMLNERKRQETAYAAEGKANDNTYQNALQGYTNVADLTAAKDSGALDAVVAGFGNTNYDQNAVRQGYNQQFDALNAREDALRVRTEAGYARAGADAMDKLNGVLASNNTNLEEVAKLQEQYASVLDNANLAGAWSQNVNKDFNNDKTFNREELTRKTSANIRSNQSSVLAALPGNATTKQVEAANLAAYKADVEQGLSEPGREGEVQEAARKFHTDLISLAPDAQLKVTSFNATEEASLQKQLDTLDLQHTQNLTSLQVGPNYDLEKEPTITITQARQVLEDKGVDRDDVQSRIESIRAAMVSNPFFGMGKESDKTLKVPGTEALSTNNKNLLLDRVLNKVIAESSGDDALVFTDNLNSTSLLEAAQTEWAAALRDQANIIGRQRLDSLNLQSRQEAADQSSQRTTEYLNEQRLLQRGGKPTPAPANSASGASKSARTKYTDFKNALLQQQQDVQARSNNQAAASSAAKIAREQQQVVAQQEQALAYRLG